MRNYEQRSKGGKRDKQSRLVISSGYRNRWRQVSQRKRNGNKRGGS